MPTIFQFQGFEVKIYTQDHMPANVHVCARGCEAIFLLNCPDQLVALRKNFRFKSQELKVIKEIVEQHQSALCQAWEEIHNDVG